MCEMGGWLTWLCLCVGMGALDGVSVCGGGLQCPGARRKLDDVDYYYDDNYTY